MDQYHHRVPDFQTDGYSFLRTPYLLPSSGFQEFEMSRPEDDLTELLWQNGRGVVMQSLNLKSMRKSPTDDSSSNFDLATITADDINISDNRSFHQQQESEAFIEDDEMDSWLQYRLVGSPSIDNNVCAELLYPTLLDQSIDQNAGATSQIQLSRLMECQPLRDVTSTARLPMPPTTRTRSELEVNNFGLFSRIKRRVESMPSSSKSVVRESTVVDSKDATGMRTEFAALELQRTSITDASYSDLAGSGKIVGGGGYGGAGMEGVVTGETILTPSTGCSSAFADVVVEKTVVNDRKRKGKQTGDSDCHCRDAAFESTDAKKKVPGVSSAKRSRAVEIHNLSERKRRDKINERMKMLQELIPHCTKADKASMLEDAIEYLKSLQLHIRLMSMGSSSSSSGSSNNMMPMMFPGVQFMPSMGMGHGMGMGIETNVNRPMMQYPTALSMAPTFPRSAGAAAAQFRPTFSYPIFQQAPHVPNFDPSTIQGTYQPDHAQFINNHPTVSNSLDPYQQYCLDFQRSQAAATQAALFGQNEFISSTSWNQAGRPGGTGYPRTS